MENLMDVNYFIKKFSAINDKNWIVNALSLPEDRDKRCSQGHCIPKSLLSKGAELWEVKFVKENCVELYSLALLFSNDYVTGAGKVADINNGIAFEYKQKSPKLRILAALNDVKKLQEFKLHPIVKREYRIVEVASRIMEKDLISCVN